MGKKKSNAQEKMSAQMNSNNAEEAQQNLKSSEPGFHPQNRPST